MAAQLENCQPTFRQVRAYFRKTEFCRFFEAGRCLKGDDCTFAHGQDEIKSVGDLTKTAICKDWAQGTCKLSSKRCAFAHGKDELRKFRDGVRKARFNSKLRGSGGNAVFNTSENEEGCFQKVCDSDSIFEFERELRTPKQSPQGQGEMVKKAALTKYASQNMLFEDKLLKDQALSNSKDVVPDFLLSAVMFYSLPSTTQQALLSILSTSLVLVTKTRTNVFLGFDRAVLCSKLFESMPDRYDD